MEWMQWAGITVCFLISFGFAIDKICRWRWRKSTSALIQRLCDTQVAQRDACYSEKEIAHLPDPVQRYFRIAIKEGQLFVKRANFSHSGTFNMSLDKSRWRPFTSDQVVVVNRPGFVWDARVQIFPTISVYVRDAYLVGIGSLRASVCALFDVAKISGSDAIAQGELLRFLAESPLYPTSLLPRHGVSWKAIDDQSAQIVLADESLEATMIFNFNPSGLIESVWAATRSRMNGKTFESMPWQARFWNYAVGGEMMVPLESEVAWLPPEGIQPYYRSKLSAISYEY